jgi:glycosyltransferase involved in cell wall biosynthesis
VRILVAIDQWFPDRQAGSARLAAASAAGLAARGHDVTVLAPRNGSVGESKEAGVVVRRVLARNALPQTLTDPVETWRHARELPDEGFDVLLAHESTTAFGLKGRAKRTPLVLMFHASAAREQRFLRSQLRPGLRKLSTYALAPPLGLLERQAVAAADRILVLSDFSRALLLDDHGLDSGRISTVPGLVDTERFTPGDGKAAARSRLGLDVDGPVLLTVRRLEPRMGIDRLLRALPLLGRADATLVVVGSGSLAGDLPRLAAELGVAERVLFVGPVSDDARLADWYRAADLFVLPTTAYEGFGMATVESLASGTPVVGTAIGATPELLAPLDPRLVAPTADPGALASTIADALDFATTEDFAARCRAQTEERFGLTNALAAWEDALEEARR